MKNVYANFFLLKISLDTFGSFGHKTRQKGKTMRTHKISMKNLKNNILERTILKMHAYKIFIRWRKFWVFLKLFPVRRSRMIKEVIMIASNFFLSEFKICCNIRNSTNFLSTKFRHSSLFKNISKWNVF